MVTRACLHPQGVKMIARVYACTTMVEEAATCLGYDKLKVNEVSC